MLKQKIKRFQLHIIIIALLVLGISWIGAKTVLASGGYQPGLQHLYPYYMPYPPDHLQYEFDLDDFYLEELQGDSPDEQVKNYAQQKMFFNELGSIVFSVTLQRISGLDPNYKSFTTVDSDLDSSSQDELLCGIAGWRCQSQRWQDFQTFARRYKLDPLTLKTQLLYINHEFNGFGTKEEGIFGKYSDIYEQVRNAQGSGEDYFLTLSQTFIDNYLPHLNDAWRDDDGNPITHDLVVLAQNIYGYDSQKDYNEEAPEPPILGTMLSGNFEPYNVGDGPCKGEKVPPSPMLNKNVSDDKGKILVYVRFPGVEDEGGAKGTLMHRCFEQPLLGLLNAWKIEADRRGLDPGRYYLRGWGYRSHQRQVDLRIEHCAKDPKNPTPYEISGKPSSECKPPTATPGKSNHEKGLAIDFYCYANGTNNNPTSFTTCRGAYDWMKDNAARYGFINFPKEPWHWSHNGR